MTLIRKTEKIFCIISIPSLYNIVVIENFDFNYFQIDLDLGVLAFFCALTKSNIDKTITVHATIGQ